MPDRMPKNIENYLKSSAFEQTIYGFMVALVNVQGKTIKWSAAEAQRYFNLSEDNCALLSIEVLYKRKNEQFRKMSGDHSNVRI